MSVIFTPTGPTVSINAPSASSESVALGSFTGMAGAVIRVLNNTTQLQFVAFGAGSATAAAATSMPIRAGEQIFVEVGPMITHAASIESAASTGDMYFTPGQAR